ncbi:efflux RND transporter periplasmic adaptor subunit [Endozoicomonas sp. GU-1]|uniref:efflux RND transporter periplasmic adaptor subunit n=1 Tax=Endozoicomonas sp. GU-1 TaxID=3009078 RepID=UPI0022B4C994|nr:efflux RND transporter periplasmic adaptor subunit [Endozoicomonas sp. GU-1]WBA83190.1 efflux RND transporter periplasmic adaptor subunit [Endozoicomonas sp. GU-1]WBA86115.1 efflux RND transporter periplasmic adaptor subunit [Endozoicomonas sp. GU-1]
MIANITDRKLGKWLPIGALATSIFLLAGCSEEQQPQHQMPPPGVSVVSVIDQEVGDYYEYIGRSEAINEVDIRARVEGFLVKRNFTEGGMVEQGQLLYEIDRAPFAAALKGAEAQLASSKASLINARKNLERSRDLVKRGAISQADYDNKTSSEAQAVAAVEAAEASLETARLNLGYTQISAPFTGEIGKSTYSVGNLVGPTSQPLATLTSMDPIYVTFQVDERQLISHLAEHPGARTAQEASVEAEEKGRFKLSLRLPNGTEYDQPGTFSFADTQIDETMGTLTLRATFPNPQGIILPGLYVTLQAESHQKTPMPLIPQAAVQQDQSGYFVLVVTPENIVETRQVEVGRRINAMWAVTSGLKQGEQIVVQGLQKVRPGGTVSPTLVNVDPTTGTLSSPASAKPQEQDI